MIPFPSLLDPDLLNDPFGWLIGGLIHSIFGQDGDPRAALDSLLAAFLDVGQPTNPFRIENLCSHCIDAYSQLRVLGVFALSVAMLARLLILAFHLHQGGPSPSHFLTDLGVRLLLGIGILQAAFWLLGWVAGQSMALAAGIMQLLAEVLLGWDHQGLEHIASNVVGEIARATAQGGVSQLSISLCILLLAAYVGYLLIMVIVSRAAIIFTILAAPLAVPVLLFSGQNQVGGIWLRMLLFAIAVPVVAVFCLVLTLLLLVAASQAHLFPGVLPLISLLAGIWISVKLINGLMMGAAGYAVSSVGGTLRAVGLASPSQMVRDVAIRKATSISPVSGGDNKSLGNPLFRRGQEPTRGSSTPPKPGRHSDFDAFICRQSTMEEPQIDRRSLWAKFLARPSLPLGRMREGV